MERHLYGIFKRIYMIRVPPSAATSVSIMENNGTPIVNSCDENDIYGGLVTVGWPIAKMVDAWVNSYPIYLQDSKDGERIYQAVEEHLQHWRNYSETTLNAKPIPTDDLIKLDNFATEIVSNGVPTETTRNPLMDTIFGDSIVIMEESSDRPSSKRKSYEGYFKNKTVAPSNLFT